MAMTELPLQSVERHSGFGEIGRAGVPESMRVNIRSSSLFPRLLANINPRPVTKRLAEAALAQTDKNEIVCEVFRAFVSDVIAESDEGFA